MKLFLIAALAATSIYAQAKANPPKEEPKERTLTEAESLKAQLFILKLQHLQDQYKIPAYQQEAQPIASEQQTFMTTICGSIGIAPDQVNTQCGMDLGLGPDGKPRTDQNGKPVAPRIWKVVPAPSPVSVPAKEPEKK